MTSLKSIIAIGMQRAHRVRSHSLTLKYVIKYPIYRCEMTKVETCTAQNTIKRVQYIYKYNDN